MNTQSKDEAKIQGVPKRTNLYARTSKYAPKAIKRLSELIDSKNESVALGAVKVILDKCLPDMKAITMNSTSVSEGKLEILIVEDKQDSLTA